MSKKPAHSPHSASDAPASPRAPLSPLMVKIGKIWSSGDGSTEKISLDVPVQFSPQEIQAISPMRADGMLVKMRKEITVVLEDFEITVRKVCEKCLKEYDLEIKIPSMERQFMEKKPKEEADLSDVMLINMENMSVDLFDMIRQEIILHFPFISVCSKGCHGLCGKCGQNLNEKRCGCSEDTVVANKPFQNLKNFLS